MYERARSDSVRKAEEIDEQRQDIGEELDQL